MAFHVKDDFKAGAPISQVPASWFNRVGSFLNNLVGGYGVKLEKNERGPSVIRLEAKPTGGAVVEPSSTVSIDSGIQQSSTMALKTDTFIAGGADGKGAVVYLPCRSVTDGAEVDIAFRPFKITNDGRIYSIGAETDWQGVIDAAMAT